MEKEVAGTVLEHRSRAHTCFAFDAEDLSHLRDHILGFLESAVPRFEHLAARVAPASAAQSSLRIFDDVLAGVAVTHERPCTIAEHGGSCLTASVARKDAQHKLAAASGIEPVKDPDEATLASVL